MVLTRRSAALGFVLGLVLLGGCSESLFGAHGSGHGSNGGDDDAGVTGCAAPCNADAAAEFDGTAGGAHSRWRYLDDHRLHSWTPMTPDKQALVMRGAEQGTQITTCKAFPDAPACGTLAGALLVSRANAPSTNDPAIELTVAEPQVLELHVEAFVPGNGAVQTIVIYRNSREDALFTGTAMPGVTFDHKITLDTIPGDRFLVAIASPTAGATDIGLNLFATATGATFPASCQVGVSFASANASTVGDLCGNTVLTQYKDPAHAAPVSLMTGPFPEQGNAADLPLGQYFVRGAMGVTSPALLDWSQDVTVQFWAQSGPVVVARPTSLFSDLDPDYGSGIEISLVQTGSVVLHVQMSSCTSPSSIAVVEVTSTYQNPAMWHFLRAVRTGGRLRVCVDGSLAMTAPIPMPCTGPSLYAPQLGASAATGAPSLSGQLDDVRVITGALPCG